MCLCDGWAHESIPSPRDKLTAQYPLQLHVSHGWEEFTTKGPNHLPDGDTHLTFIKTIDSHVARLA
jgi:hypothetical protein